MTKFVLDRFGVNEMQTLGKVGIGDPLAFTGTVHLGPAKDREEEGIIVELVIRQEHRADPGRLILEGLF